MQFLDRRKVKMSVIFRVETDKLNEIKNMSVSDFLEFMENKYESLIEEEEFFENKIENVILALGYFEYSSRGFEFYIEENHIEVRINTPATSKDWNMCLVFIKELKEKTNAKLFTEDDEEFKNVEEINYEQDILYGINAIKNRLEEDDLKSMKLIGTDRSIEISREMINDILNSDDVIEAFDETLEKVFHSGAYFSKQLLYKIDDEIVGVYTIGDGYDVVIPLVPSLDFKNQHVEEEYGKVTKWSLSIVFQDEDEEIVELDYLENISKIKEYKKLDNNQIEISAKTKEELKEIFGLN